ncbi:sigma-70 family RNA polymerase sigma factor [Sphingobacterium alkalisoli]|uniref:Sigma-70 family RNA polymerase sigma factor n=1 Tax=Sphingobacterium alkalisoli TaxID=1874115 RepID=A0A4U0GUS1_9SPHI|nr:sigma-70 family RNA polymerase sigma factor [Sphingobacterium alkalisoli]TJY62737.1 sigma-70 family RNA polymerase sigma factor [Sphingobacterium alkalisoli]GGH28562.1 DNA-directed RNA polymerase sigma-70 factor [Sphingobacterium alkalisoli]
MSESVNEKVMESDLLNRMAAGDSLAFDAIYTRYWEHAFSAAYKRLKDLELARDIVQDIFLQLWLRREELIIDNLGAYLYIAVRNRVFKCMDRAQRFTPLPELFDQLFAARDQSDAEIIRKEFLLYYEALVATLSPSQQEIFRMRYHDDLSTLEIADRLSITRKTVQNQLGKSVAQLRQSLGMLILIYLLKYW